MKIRDHTSGSVGRFGSFVISMIVTILRAVCVIGGDAQPVKPLQYTRITNYVARAILQHQSQVLP